MATNYKNIVLERSVHVSGLGSNPEMLSSEQKQVFLMFKKEIQSFPEVEANKDYVEDCVLINFLVARDWDAEKSKKMLKTALQWRMKRPCHRWYLNSLPGEFEDKVDRKREELFNQCGNTGKIRVPGIDKHGRTVMVFDNSRENMTDSESMIEFLAYNMELCKRTAILAGKGADKMMLFMHMSDFSIFNQPAMAVTKETLTIVSLVFPESLGTCVILNPPTYFLTFWNLVHGWIDPKTSSKVFFVNGDISDGSQNDALMKKLIGDNWKELTGAGKPISNKQYSKKHWKEIDASPGYDHNQYWPSVLDRDARYLSLRTNQLANQSSDDATLAQSNASNLTQDSEDIDVSEKVKLIVGRRRVFEYNSEKWYVVRNSYEIDHGFLARFQWEKLKGRKVLIGGKEVRVYEGESADGKYLVKEVTVELHHWLLDNTMSYVNHVTHKAPHNVHESILFRVFGHFKEEQCGKMFVILSNYNTTVATSDLFTPLKIASPEASRSRSFSRSSSFTSSSSSLIKRDKTTVNRSTSRRKTSFGLYMNEEDGSWGPHRAQNTLNTLLVLKSEFSGFLKVLQQDLKWLESVGVIDFQIPISTKIESTSLVDLSSHRAWLIPPFVCRSEDQRQVHSHRIGFITFPTNLTSNPKVANKFCAEYRAMVVARFCPSGMPLGELAFCESQTNEEDEEDVRLVDMKSSLNSREQPFQHKFLSRDFLVLVMSAPAYAWFIDTGPLSLNSYAKVNTMVELSLLKIFETFPLDSQPDNLLRYISCGVEVMLVVAVMLAFSHFAASAAVGDNDDFETMDNMSSLSPRLIQKRTEGKNPLKRMLRHSVKFMWDLIVLSTFITFAAFSLSALSRGKENLPNSDIYSIEFAQTAVSNARLWGPRFVAVNSAFFIATRALRDYY